jgi:hypothetical protein
MIECMKEEIHPDLSIMAKPDPVDSILKVLIA